MICYVALSQLNMTPAVSKVTSLEAFLKLPETTPASEYIDGQIIQKPMPKGRHSSLQGELCAHINRKSKPSKTAYAFPELRCTFGGRSIVPDVAVFKWQNIPFDENGQVLDNFNRAPDWMIEILSPEQKSNRVIGNLLHALKYGTQLGWFIEPDDLSILVLTPPQLPMVITGSDLLPTLTGVDIELSVSEVFGWLSLGL